MVVPTKLYSGHLSTHFSQQQKSRSPKQKVAGMKHAQESWPPSMYDAVQNERGERGYSLYIMSRPIRFLLHWIHVAT